MIDDARLCIVKAHTVAACQDEQNLQHIVKILGKACDDQNVPAVQEVLLNEDLRRRLKELHHYGTAEALEVFGAAHEAFNMPGIEPDCRTERLAKLKKYLQAVGVTILCGHQGWSGAVAPWC